MLLVYDNHIRKEAHYFSKKTYDVISKKHHTECVTVTQRQQPGNRDSEKQEMKRRRHEFEVLIRLNPRYAALGKHHYINKCGVTEKDNRATLLEQY